MNAKLALFGLAGLFAAAPMARAQTRPYIGFTYPAGGQQGTTFQIKLGGQGLDDVNGVFITGSGVKARVVEYLRKLSPQEMQLLRAQLAELKRSPTAVASAASPMMSSEDTMMSSSDTMMSATVKEMASAMTAKSQPPQQIIAKVEKRIREYVQQPACASISSLVIAEVTVAPDAEPGLRELRLVTPRGGASNPLVFHVGQLPEHSRDPMITATIQILGKEAQALRKRPADQAEARIALPCTVNGQIASGEVNRYRFNARKGQRLVISTLARQLIPYIADAVPGWFQPVLALYDARGKEVAFADDYRFRPDPVILYEVPADGEYVFAIYDSIYRGREDFVYRISIGELPFVTSVFPLGGQVGTSATPKMKGWNLQDAVLTPPAKDAPPGIRTLAATKKELVSNPVPFALDKLPNGFDKDTNNTSAAAQKVSLPLIINGRIDRPDDWDVFQFTGKSNDMFVAEVQARRLDSPLDSVIKLTDAAGKLLAFSDDREDLGAGVNTHPADSYFMVKLPADGAYFVHIGDTARKGGEDYGYRLRLSWPQPDFELRIVSSSLALRTKATANLTVYAQRKDGFTGPIKLALKDPPPAGITASPVTLWGTQVVATARLSIKSSQTATVEPVSLSIVGSAKVGQREIVHEAAAAEDRMQAFLWRHLVPASDLKLMVCDPSFQPPPKRVAPARPAVTATAQVASAGTDARPKFTKQQVASRLRQLKLLFEEGVLTDDFYSEKVAECDVAQ